MHSIISLNLFLFSIIITLHVNYIITKVLVHSVAESPEIHSLPSFLFGQSMGGAVALKMQLKQPKAWDGAILVAPMCKVFFFLKQIHVRGSCRIVYDLILTRYSIYVDCR
jgi:alpha-beta hydrolase superfamily lysophospholipase